MTRHPSKGGVAAGSLKLQAGLSDLQLIGGGWGRRVKWAVHARAESFVCSENAQPLSKRSFTEKKNNTKKQLCFEGRCFARKSSFGSSRFLNSEWVCTRMSPCVPLGNRTSPTDFPLSSGSSLTLARGWAVCPRYFYSLAHHPVGVINHQVPSLAAASKSRTKMTSSFLASKEARRKGWT